MMSQSFATCLLAIAMPSGLLAFQSLGRPVQRKIAKASIDSLGHVPTLTSLATTASSPPIYDIEFGGAQHFDEDQEQIRSYDFVRPEQAKSEQCIDGVCSDCARRNQCWHGVYDDQMKVKMKANSMYNELAFKVWARCVTSGEWQLEIKRISNAVISFYIDGALQREVRTVTDESSDVRIPSAGNKSYHVRVALRPIDTSRACEAKIELKLHNVAKVTDQCMGIKDCLSVFGDKSPASFRGRNSNEWQLRCLEADTLAGAASEDKCIEWLACLPNTTQAKLKVFLRAAGTQTGSMLVEKSGAQQSTACLDPSVEDPEGWDCDCLEKMVDSCGGLSEECLKNRMCKIEKVCDAWKEQHCSSEMIATHKNTSTKVGREASTLMSRRTKPEANVGDSLDSSLTGKCSQ